MSKRRDEEVLMATQGREWRKRVSVLEEANVSEQRAKAKREEELQRQIQKQAEEYQQRSQELATTATQSEVKLTKLVEAESQQRREAELEVQRLQTRAEENAQMIAELLEKIEGQQRARTGEAEDFQRMAVEETRAVQARVTELLDRLEAVEASSERVAVMVAACSASGTRAAMQEEDQGEGAGLDKEVARAGLGVGKGEMSGGTGDEKKSATSLSGARAEESGNILRMEDSRQEEAEDSTDQGVNAIDATNPERQRSEGSLNPRVAAFSPQKTWCEEKHRIMVIIAEQLSAKGASKPGASSPVKAAGAAVAVPAQQGKQKVAAKGGTGGPRQGKGEGQGSGGVINRLSQEFIYQKGLESYKALLEREVKKKGSEELTEGATTTEEKKFHAGWNWRWRKKRQDQSERG